MPEKDAFIVKRYARCNLEEAKRTQGKLEARSLLTYYAGNKNNISCIHALVWVQIALKGI